MTMTREPSTLFYRGRHALVLGLFLAACATLVWRVVELQVTRHDFLQRQGDARYLRDVSIVAHRGKILDRNGEPLAVSTPVDSVWVNPALLARARPRWGELTALLGLDSKRLEAIAAQLGGREFVYLRRRLDPALAARVAALDIAGVNLQREYRRYYPMGEAAAQWVGVTNVDDAGQEGIELAYQKWLQGVAGTKRVLRDRLGHAVEDIGLVRAPRAGRNLMLTMDRRIQYLAYRALFQAVRRERARAGTVVVLDTTNGEVLAIANYPSFNPNNLADRRPERVRNRAITDVFEPGSTIKPFTIAAALMSGEYRADTPIDTSPGFIRVGGHTVRDARNYGRIDVATVIKKSSNVGAARIALSIPPRDLWQTLIHVGFGERTASGLPGETGGVLDHYFEWGRAKNATLAYGYGISVTALQLAHAYAAIANDGLLLPVRVVRSDAAGKATRVMPARVARALRRMLEGVVSRGGTGWRGRIAGYRVGGKTGTVKKPVAGGYSENRYLALFVSMAPLSNPRLVTVVMIDEPSAGRYYGGQVAAPVSVAVMSGALRLIGAVPDAPDAAIREVALGGGDLALAHAGLGR